MTRLRQIIFRLQPFFRRRKIETDLSEEMRVHLEMATEANVASGMPPEAARYAARLEFGGVDQVKEAWRDERGIRWIEDLLRDLRFAARSLRKNPGFALAVVATLAIGIGATTAIVSYARPIVFPKLPYVQPERLVVVTDLDATGAQPETPYPFFSFPYRLAFYRESATSFAALGGSRFDQMNLVVHNDPAAATISWVTADFLPLLSATAEHGRLFLPEEHQSNRGDVAVLTWALWEKRFGADPGIVGQNIFLAGRARRVVGILSRQFRPPNLFNPADIYLPDALSPTPTSFPFQWLQVAGRLKAGATIEQARAEIARLCPPPPGWNPTSFERFKPRIVPLTAYYQTDRSCIYWVFLGAVGFLYAIACSNAVSLLLARTVARRRELGVRLAMGGSRWQIVRLLLTESLILATLGGLIGILVAQWGYWALMSRQPPQAPAAVVQIWNLNLPMLVTVMAVSVLTSVLVVVIPALQIKHIQLGDALKEGAGALGTSRRLQRLRSCLVVTQAALAVALLAGAGLTLQSFWRLERVSLGFDPANKLAVSGMLPDAGISQEMFLNLATRFRDALAGVPGVVDVTCSGVLPMAHFASTMGVKIDGRPELGEIQFSYNHVSPEYFATLGLALLSGRDFTGMRPGDPPVAIINQTAAHRYFGSNDPVGKRLDLDRFGEWEIVGVVADVREWGRRQEIKPQLYAPFWQPPVNTGSFIELVRLAAAPPPGLEAMIRRAAYAAEPRLTITVDHLADNARQDVRNERNAMLILQVLSALALVLAATGLFAVMAYAVAQRQREFGVRMALGAAPGDLLRLVLRWGFLLAALGVVIGLGAAWGLTQFLQSVLFETNPREPITYLGVTVVLLGVAAAACWFPARRASRINPVEALRAE